MNSDPPLFTAGPIDGRTTINLSRPFRLRLPSGATLELPAGAELTETTTAPAVEAAEVAALDPGKVYVLTLTMPKHATMHDYAQANDYAASLCRALDALGVKALAHAMEPKLAINPVEPNGEIAHTLERLDALAEYVRVGLALIRAEQRGHVPFAEYSKLAAAERRAFPRTVPALPEDPR